MYIMMPCEISCGENVFFSNLSVQMSESSFSGYPEGPKTRIWPDGRMPDAQPHQFAAMTEEAAAPDFNPDENRVATLQWFQPPSEKNATDLCMVVVSGGGYSSCCDIPAMSSIVSRLLAKGIHCVNFTYRVPRPEGLPIYKTAWEDAQRAIRLVRLEATKRGFSPRKIGMMGCSAGSHLGMLLAFSSQTPAYEPIDEADSVPCNIAWAIPMCPAYVLTDGLLGANEKKGFGEDVAIASVFSFDSASCPACFMHGGLDPYSPMGSVLSYCRLLRMGIPAELHLEANGVHGFMHYVRMNPTQVILDFLRHRGFLKDGEPIAHSPATAEENIARALDWGRKCQQGIQEDLSLW